MHAIQQPFSQSPASHAGGSDYRQWVASNLDHVAEELNRHPDVSFSISQLCWFLHEAETFLLCMTVAGFSHLKIPALSEFFAACTASTELTDDLKDGVIDTDAMLMWAICASAVDRACWPLSIQRRADILRREVLELYTCMDATRALYLNRHHANH
jgi:hypothetical protein